jgi:hypothetical protein
MLASGIEFWSRDILTRGKLINHSGGLRGFSDTLEMRDYSPREVCGSSPMRWRCLVYHFTLANRDARRILRQSTLSIGNWQDRKAANVDTQLTIATAVVTAVACCLLLLAAACCPLLPLLPFCLEPSTTAAANVNVPDILDEAIDAMKEEDVEAEEEEETGEDEETDEDVEDTKDDEDIEDAEDYAEEDRDLLMYSLTVSGYNASTCKAVVVGLNLRVSMDLVSFSDSRIDTLAAALLRRDTETPRVSSQHGNQATAYDRGRLARL